ncbi:MAG: glycosyl hydrolase [Pseudomonadota bacterium]
MAEDHGYTDPLSSHKGVKDLDTLSGKPLGYDETKHVVRMMMEVTTEDFRHGGTGERALQIVFPHHRKAMIAEDLVNILKGQDRKPKYTWRSLVGELQGYEGNSYVRELQTYGVLPFLSSVAVNSASRVNGKLPADDIYNAMKTWFFEGEPATATINPFCRDQGYYLGYSANTYIYGTATLFEGLVLADQLAQSSQLTMSDENLNKSKNAVAAEMRDFILQSLKEMVGQWADIYTSQWFQYNPKYYTIYGFPEGYLSVQNLCDKHFHWGYFLRSAAAIGRYDKGWLQNHMPLFEKLVADVASFDRGNEYPFLRNFSPFYGHSWADGLANGGPGNNQESTSEAINFVIGMIELGQILGNKDWRDIGMYLYEEEILGTQQYWFNQDADLENSSGQFYNGNWPDSFVHYNNNAWINPIVGVLQQRAVKRECFWGNKPYSDYVIHYVPLSSSQLHVGRNQEWLAKAWEQFERDSFTETATTGSPYEVLLAGLQARLPGTGTKINDPGPIAALTRINQTHLFYQAATNAMGKHWAYTNHLLGQVDTTVTSDTASYGVFRKSDGTRSYVAYNPGSTKLTVTFSDGATLTDIPAYSMAYKNGKSGTQTIDKLSAPTGNQNRLYLSKPTSYPASCDALSPQDLTLTSEPGTWKPSAGTSPFPEENSGLSDSIVCVPARPQQQPPTYQPDDKYVRTWKGTFSGKLVTDAFTRFAIYSNQSLFPGWQFDPETQGTPPVPSNCFVINIIYDFNGDGTGDRWEQYPISPVGGNTFAYQNKPTEYDFDQVWPKNISPMILGGPTGTMKAGFPSIVSKGKITVKIWGGQLGEYQSHALPVPISVNADPITNRASWVQPPYQPYPPHR